MDTSNHTMSTKICTKCGEEKLATTEYFEPTPHGFRGSCRECRRDYYHRYDAARRDIRREYNKQYHSEHASELCQYQRRWRNEHIQAIRERDRQYYDAHKDEICTKKRKYYIEHIDEVKNRLQKYHAEHSEEFRRYAVRYRVEHPEYGRRYYTQNAERMRLKSRLRRAHKNNASGTHTAADIRLQIKSQTDKRGRLHCWWCSELIEGDTYHVDHRIPLAKGGSNAPENLCISCPTCNLSKGAKLPQEWSDRLL